MLAGSLLRVSALRLPTSEDVIRICVIDFVSKKWKHKGTRYYHSTESCANLQTSNIAV